MLRDFEIKSVHSGVAERRLDSVAIEEPLAIHISYWRKNALSTESLAVTMRSPGADRELAAGLLVSEGIIQAKKDLVEVRSLGLAPSNEVLAELERYVDFEAWRQRRNGLVASSCGICGKASLEQIQEALPSFPLQKWRVSSEFIQSLPSLLKENQPVFWRSGGVHAAAIFSLDRNLQWVFEDVGRHNALDKAIGSAVLNDCLPLTQHVLFLSSRSSFELVQKAAMAGIQVLASVGSPSSLAVETARRLGMTLICFVREERFNIYSGDWRLEL